MPSVVLANSIQAQSASAGVTVPEPPEPPVDESFAILFEDDALAIVAKSGNIPCHPGGRYRDHTLAHLLAERAGFPALHWVNRLDRETSGTVVVAKTAEVASRLGRALMRGRFAKRYLAIVQCGGVQTLPQADSAAILILRKRGGSGGAGGSPADHSRCLAGEPPTPRQAPNAKMRIAADSGAWETVRGTLHPARGCGVRKMRLFVREGEAPPAPDSGAAIVPTGPGQLCETRFRLLDQRGGFALVEAEPVTGRVHQIRATLRAMGLPVVGDKLYGPDPGIYARLCDDAMTEADRASLLLPRQALHAASIAFPHPFTGALIHVEAPLPPDMKEFWAASSTLRAQ